MEIEDLEEGINSSTRDTLYSHPSIVITALRYEKKPHPCYFNIHFVELGIIPSILLDETPFK
jgi:hypothetical protein